MTSDTTLRPLAAEHVEFGFQGLGLEIGVRNWGFEIEV